MFPRIAMWKNDSACHGRKTPRAMLYMVNYAEYNAIDNSHSHRSPSHVFFYTIDVLVEMFLATSHISISTTQLGHSLPPTILLV